MGKKAQPTIVALLTGRGGSTLKNKNVLPILGKPLLYYPAKAARDSRYIEAHFVSSDDEKILKAAEAVGYERIKRPPALSKPDAQHGDVIRHAVKEMKKRGTNPDLVVVILANSVTTKTQWLDDCIRMMMMDDSLTCVAPAFEDSDHHPHRAKRLNRDGFFEPFFDFKGKKVSSNRQDLDPSYFFCHTFWVIRASNLDRDVGHPPWTFMGHRTKPYVMKEATFDVHERGDVVHSEAWVRANVKKV